MIMTATIRRRIIRIVIAAVILAVYPIMMIYPASSNFSNGTHLINADTVPHAVTFTDHVLTTRICNCVRPTKTMKNGIVSVHMRDQIKGFIIIRIADVYMGDVKVTGIILPGAKISCISTGSTNLSVDFGKPVLIDDGNTAVIRGGKIFAER